MAKKKKREKRVSNTFVLVTASEGKKDEEGQKRLTEAQAGIVKSGFRLVKTAEVEDEFGRRSTVYSGKTDAGNFLLIGEKPL